MKIYYFKFSDPTLLQDAAPTPDTLRSKQNKEKKKEEKRENIKMKKL